MTEIVQVKNVSYARYEELILRRDNLQKEAFQYRMAYVREFGDAISEVFNQKIACIKKKKSIEYCQAVVNHGRTVDQDQLQAYLQKEVAVFQEQLDKMIRETQDAKSSKKISEVDLLTIKRIYRKLVKKIHPDLNPKTDEITELQELWLRILTAYQCNDKKSMQELELLTASTLDRLDIGQIDIDIPNLEDKIEELEKEIITIRETDPYTYQYLLNDPKAVAEKKAALEEELHSYMAYAAQLDESLKEFGMEGLV